MRKTTKIATIAAIAAPLALGTTGVASAAGTGHHDSDNGRDDSVISINVADNGNDGDNNGVLDLGLLGDDDNGNDSVLDLGLVGDDNGDNNGVLDLGLLGDDDNGNDSVLNLGLVGDDNGDGDNGVLNLSILGDDDNGNDSVLDLGLVGDDNGDSNGNNNHDDGVISLNLL